LSFSSAVVAQVSGWEGGAPVVDLAVDHPSKGPAVGLDHPPRTQAVHGAGDQDHTYRERMGRIVHAWTLEDTVSRGQQLGLA
jgi:hypothetical protein